MDKKKIEVLGLISALELQLRRVKRYRLSIFYLR